MTSNNHSLVNLSLGFAARHKEEILTCARGLEDPEFVGSFDSFQNCFSARNLVPYLHEAAVFDDQRSLTVHGTFLHSWDAVRGLHRADFTGISGLWTSWQKLVSCPLRSL